MKYITHNKRKRGFTILELIVAIFIIITGIVAAASLITYSISAVIIGKSQIIATSLAQEGLEVIRNIRDNNWHCIADPECNLIGGDEYPTHWKDELGVCAPPTGCQVEYSDLKNDLIAYTGNSLKLSTENGYGYYQYTIGDSTRFYRKITITDISDEEIKVVSEVTYTERTKSYSVAAEDRLYDWK